jgi:hypothetical protein
MARKFIASLLCAGAILLLAAPHPAAAQCTARTRISGIWLGDDGGTYVLRRTGGTTIWWVGRSADGGKSFTNVFKGVRNGNRITGDWADVLSHNKDPNSGIGSLILEINSTKQGNQEFINGFKKVGGSGAGFGASSWRAECKQG